MSPIEDATELARRERTSGPAGRASARGRGRARALIVVALVVRKHGGEEEIEKESERDLRKVVGIVQRSERECVLGEDQ